MSLLPREYTYELHDVDAAELHEHQGGELFDVELYERAGLALPRLDVPQRVG